MAAIESVVVAGFVHLVIRFALYVTPQTVLKTPGPATPTFIVCLALMDLIYHSRIIPQRFDDMSTTFKYAFECLTVIFLLELGMLLWESIEHTIFLVVKGALLSMKVIPKPTYYKQQNVIIGAFTLPLSLVIFAAVEQSHNKQ
ncbi:hypothetical protein AWZ03_006334 [Drosophila navojoa]|uniref:Uncharacterized protein n=1 Tax=Drosophila navojoa TaxID=7232 RepID=A0A484BEJ4_DRONA|nr:hypothetical protein AWZ03_006334 [Drosophila navojoa]